MFDTNYEFHGDMWKNIVPSKNYNPIKWLNTHIHRRQSLSFDIFSLKMQNFQKTLIQIQFRQILGLGETSLIENPFLVLYS
jgi:hypothetical protein